MNLTQYMTALRNNPAFMANVTSWKVLPPRTAKYADFPESVDPRIVQVMNGRGIYRLYCGFGSSVILLQAYTR